MKPLRDSPTRFSISSFLYHLPGSLANGLELFSILVKCFIQIFKLFKFKKNGLPRVSDSGKNDSPEYQTQGRLTRQSIRLREFDSPEYQTQGRLTHQSIRLRGD